MKRRQTIAGLEREAIRTLYAIDHHCGFRSDSICFQCNRRFAFLLGTLKRLCLTALPSLPGESCLIKRFEILENKNVSLDVVFSVTGAKNYTITNEHILSVLADIEDDGDDEEC